MGVFKLTDADEKKRLKLGIALVCVIVFGVLLLIATIIGNASSKEYDGETIQSEARLEAERAVKNVEESVSTEGNLTYDVESVTSIVLDMFNETSKTFIPVAIMIAVIFIIGALINALFRVGKYR